MRIAAFAICLTVMTFFNSSLSLSASTDLQVSATLRMKVAVTTLQNLAFGEIIVSESPSGTLAIQPDGSVETTGAGLSSGGASLPQAGQVNIISDSSQLVDVSCASAVVANQSGETFPVSVIVATAAQDSGITCAGLGAPVLTVDQQSSSSSVFVGGVIDASDLSGINASAAFSSGLASGSPAVFQAVYQ